MVKTGYISFITETPAGQDANGNVTPSEKVSSVFIECNLDTIKKEYKVLIHGEYQQASYSLIIDSDKINTLDPSINFQSISEVHLQDNNGNDLNIFRIADLEYLNLTKRVKIVV